MTDTAAQGLSERSPGDVDRVITHDEAQESAQRLINSHFHKEPHARIGIPARPGYDDDLVICQYIRQQVALASPVPAQAEGRAWVGNSYMQGDKVLGFIEYSDTTGWHWFVPSAFGELGQSWKANDAAQAREAVVAALSPQPGASDSTRAGLSEAGRQLVADAIADMETNITLFSHHKALWLKLGKERLTAAPHAQQATVGNMTVGICESFASIGIDISEDQLRQFEKSLFERGLNFALRTPPSPGEHPDEKPLIIRAAESDARALIERMLIRRGDVEGVAQGRAIAIAEALLRGGMLAPREQNSAEKAMSPEDWQFLDRLRRDNTYDGSRFVIESEPDFSQAFRLSDEGYIGIDQRGTGIICHISRKGLKALNASPSNAKAD
jgi:hypothetical protein